MRTKYPYEEFQIRLRDACKDFFTHYTKAGGDPDNVIALLWFLTPESKKGRISSPHYPAVAKDFKRKLIQLEGACAGLLPFFPTNPKGQILKLKETVEAAKEAAHKVRRSDAAMRGFIKACGIPGKRGRPKGPGNETVILAVLVQECRARFGRPRYKEIVALAQAVAPKLLQMVAVNDTPEVWLRIRIRKVPQTVIDPIYQNFFA